MWKLNRKIPSCVGAEVYVFIQHTSIITAFLDDNCASTEHLESLLEGITLWPGLNELLKISRLQNSDNDDYREKRKSLKKN